MRFVIVTGMSGAGKSTALKILEDVGYFCADNLPIPLVEKFAELACASDSKYDKVALGVDIRNGEAIRGMQEVLEQLMIRGISYEVLYLDASERGRCRRAIGRCFDRSRFGSFVQKRRAEMRHAGQRSIRRMRSSWRGVPFWQRARRKPGTGAPR